MKKIANVLLFFHYGLDNIKNNPRTVYDYEVGIYSNSTTYDAKIGLIYTSDYGFSTSNTYWLDTLDNVWSSAKNYNWLYLGSTEWTITRTSDTLSGAFRVDSSGYIGYDYSTSLSHEVRPCFYLNSNVSYVSGTGSSSEPFRIN